MDSPNVSQLFRQLFSRRARNCLRSPIQGTNHSSRLQCRHYVSRRSKDPTGTSSWQQRIDAFPKDMSNQLREYPQVTAKELRSRRQRPRRVKMLIRDFIEDSLYNPNYGYFPKHATIFNSPEPFDFGSIKDDAEFNRMVDEQYVKFEDALDKVDPDETRQLWHTPTELFRPHYGEAIARYLVAHYRLTLFPYHDLVVYELGAGNGTLMLNILDYIRDVDPDVYQRTKFRMVEISSWMAELQMRNVTAGGHTAHVEIVNRSIFDWDTYVNSPSFVLAFEVIDNFGHDILRYNPQTEQPLQGNVLIDEEGEFFEYYERNLDPIASRYLRIREASAKSAYTTPLINPKFIRNLRYSLPLAPNLSRPEYIPTRLMQFFDVLHNFFPAHRLIVADFNYLPDAVPGVNAPVVQTRYQRRNVPVTTPLVHQGFFDIFFPTNFSLMEDIYRAITGKLTRVMSHKDFLEKWAYVQDTETKNGENPMLSWYANASVMTTI